MNAVPVVASALLGAIAVGAALDPARIPRRHIDAHAGSFATGQRWSAWLGSRRGRRQVAGPAALGRWADEIARSLRHGSTLRAALESVDPDDELREAAATLRLRIERGATVSEAMDAWADEIATRRARGGELLVAFAAVVGAAAELGGSASLPLERFAVAMRQRVSDDLERRAQSAQARMSARVLTMVPLAMLALLVATDADVREVLGEPTGATVVAVGLGLNAAGSWWMRRIVGSTDREFR